MHIAVHAYAREGKGFKQAGEANMEKDGYLLLLNLPNFPCS